MSIIANYWAARGWQIMILSFDDGSLLPFYDLDKRIEYRALGIDNRDASTSNSQSHRPPRIQARSSLNYTPTIDIYSRSAS